MALKRFNPFNNFSLLNSIGEDNGAEVMETLRTLNESRHLSGEVDNFNKLIEEFERYKNIEKLKENMAGLMSKYRSRYSLFKTVK